MPIPPPMHREAPPFLAFFLFMLYRSVTKMRAPDDPTGWPSAMAPPLMLTYVHNNSCNMDTRGLPDMYTQSLRAVGLCLLCF